LVIVGFLVVVMASTIAACGRAELDGTRKHETLSIDLRQRVLDAADRGISRRQIVEMFEVSLSTVKRYLKLRSQTGQLAPKPIPGRTPTKGAVLATDLPAQLAAHHGFTLEQHCKLWASSHGVQVSTASMSRAIARLGWCGGYFPDLRANEQVC
jgi:transposase